MSILARGASLATTRCVLPSSVPLGLKSASNRMSTRSWLREVAAAALHEQAISRLDESVRRRSVLLALASLPGLVAVASLAADSTIRQAGW